MAESEVVLKARAAKAAAARLAGIGAQGRNAALLAMADALAGRSAEILSANDADVQAARAAGTAEPLIDRLMLNEERIAGIAAALRELALQPDPIGVVTEGRTLYNGIKLRRVRVPLGVVAMIYEARPNVTADAAGLTLKTGNACILRGGSLANRSNLAMAKVLYEASLSAAMPEGWLQAIETTDRAATAELMQLRDYIDVLVPRGSASLIKSTIENAKVPVIETGEGNCHLYVHETADPEIIVPIALNAKTQRPGVCNAIESLLIDASVAERLAPPLLGALAEAGVVIHADEHVFAIGAGMGEVVASKLVKADETDWGREYLDLEISIKTVSGVEEAVAHINRYSTHHSESILASDAAVIARFLDGVDSAAVYANASTRFTDGGEFGLGAEIGISTQKLHARGPMGLDALTSTKFVLEGSGQIRG